MDGRSEILVVDYENSISNPLNHLFTNGYHMRVANTNSEASELVDGSDLVILIANEKRRECIKLMEHLRKTYDQNLDFIVILGCSDDLAFMDRIDDMTFQCFRRNRYSNKDLTKAIRNALEMRKLRMKEQQFVHDLDRIEDELKKVEHRLYTISNLREISRNTPFLN